MTEKGIMIGGHASGDYIACREADEQDDQANDRIIPRVSFSCDKFLNTGMVYNRGDGTPVAVYDGTDIEYASLPSDLTNNLITVGDKSTLVVLPELQSSSDSVSIVPLIIDDEATPEVCHFLFKQTVNPVGPYTPSFYNAYGYTGYRPLIWDVFGAYKIGIFIASIAGGSCKVKAYVI